MCPIVMPHRCSAKIGQGGERWHPPKSRHECRVVTKRQQLASSKPCGRSPVDSCSSPLAICSPKRAGLVSKSTAQGLNLGSPAPGADALSIRPTMIARAASARHMRPLDAIRLAMWGSLLLKGVWRNGSASDSRSEGWEFESLCPHFKLGRK